MQNSNKLVSFTLSKNQNYILAGSLSGYLKIISLDGMNLISDVFIHGGSIQAVTAHPYKDLVATRSMDNSIALVDIKDINKPRIIDRFVVRDIKAKNDDILVKPNYSFSQAIDFHPFEDKIVTRNGSAAILEIGYKSNNLAPINCFRLHKDEDLTTVKYVLNGEYLLSGGRGEIFLSKDGKITHRWSTPVSNNHWFEKLTPKSYLVANDSRRLLKINLGEKLEIENGPIFCRDDFEHVTYNANSHFAYCAGFDGDIYEMDPNTLLVTKIVWTAPFKMRWIFSIKDNPNLLVFHCFNGSIYKLNISTKQIAEFKPENQPNSIWTSAKNNGHIYFAGEGSKIINFKLKLNENHDSTTELEIIKKDENIKTKSYTKRIAFINNSLIIAEKNGQIFTFLNNKFKDIIDLKEEIRDICIDKTQNNLFACTERGNVKSIDLNTNRIKSTFNSENHKPFWSLALQENNNLLAVAESHGKISILNSKSMEELKHKTLISDRPKRMKWLDNNLLFVEGVSLKRYDFVEDEVFNYIEECENTIEDFIWNVEYGYLILIGYMKELILCDLSSGRKLYTTSDQMDFSLGLEWINIPKEKNSYPLDFVTYGTSGNLQAYRIHNDRIISLGKSYEAILN